MPDDGFEEIIRIINQKKKITLIKHIEDINSSMVGTEDGISILKEEALFVNGRYYVKNSNLLVEDFFTKKITDLRLCDYFYKDFDEELNVIPNKYYTREDCDIVTICCKSESYPCLFNCVPNNYIEDISSGIFYHPSFKDNSHVCTTKHNKIKGRKVSNTYPDFSQRNPVKMGVKSLTYNIFEGKQYSFGIELETSSGNVPKRFDKDLNYSSVRDGSLRHKDDGEEYGLEYVTGILTGDSGLKQLKSLCNILNKYCMVDDTCGVHIHLSGITNSKENIVFLYKIMQKFEAELQAMLPKSRRNNAYCKNLKKIEINIPDDYFTNSNSYKYTIEDNYLKIFRYVSHTLSTFSHNYNKLTNHPKGSKCGYDHNTARYCWLNLVPFMFNTRGDNSYSLEIRNHSATTNYKKIRNYLMIFMGILWYVENRKCEIAFNNTLRLEDVILAAYPKKGNKLMNYYNDRVENFKSKNSDDIRFITDTEYDEVIEVEKEIKYSDL